MRSLKIEIHWTSVKHSLNRWLSHNILMNPKILTIFFYFFLLSLYHIQYAKCTIKQIYKSKHLCNGSGCGGSVERLERWGRSLSSWSRSTQAKKSGEIIIIIINTVILVISIFTIIATVITNMIIKRDLAVNVVVGIWSIGERRSKLGGGHLLSIGFTIWSN